MENKLLKLLIHHQPIDEKKILTALQTNKENLIKIINQLKKKQIPISITPHNQYVIIPPIELLSLEHINQYLSPGLKNQISIEILNTTDSTNNYLSNQTKHAKSNKIVIAEHQSAGKGQNSNQWESPYGYNIYLSILWLTHSRDSLNGISLATGVAVSQALSECKIQPVQLKWPNDIYYCNHKLGGILTECIPTNNENYAFIIGIGINIWLPEKIKKIITQPVTDLYTITKHKFHNRNQLTASILNQTIRILNNYDGYQPFFKQWNEMNLYQNKMVTLTTHQNKYCGISKGIDHNGSFLIINENNEKLFIPGNLILSCALKNK